MLVEPRRLQSEPRRRDSVVAMASNLYPERMEPCSSACRAAFQRSPLAQGEWRLELKSFSVEFLYEALNTIRGRRVGEPNEYIGRV